MTRVDGVALAEPEWAALQALSDRLLRHRTEGAAPSEAADDLAALIGRAGR